MERVYIAISLMAILAVGGIVGVAQSGQVYEVGTLVDANGMRYLVIYYGWINTSTLLDNPPDILIFAGSTVNMDNQAIIDQLRSMGVRTYAYIHDGDTPVGLGSSFNDMVVNGGRSVAEWRDYINSLISSYAGKVDGLFLDEVDPGYFTSNLDPGNSLIQDFSQALQDIVSYAHSLGLEVIVNGVRAYAGYGDYYLWESFCSTFTGSPMNPTYVYVTSFFQRTSADSNPYVWINNIAKYEYLEANNLLGSTLAVSLGPIGDNERGKTCSMAAQILGFHAWGYGDSLYYSQGGGPPPVYAYPLGPRVAPPVISESSGSMSASFYAGTIEVTVTSTDWRVTVEDLLVTLPPLNPAIQPAASGDAPTGLDITGYADYYDGAYHSFYIQLDSPFTGNAIHVYIDTDGSQATGYQPYGAEIMVEAYPSGAANIFQYTGSGTDWSWSQISAGTAVFDGAQVKISTPIEQGSSFKMATLDSTWSIADVEPDTPAPLDTASYPTPFYALHKRLNEGASGIAVIQRGVDSDILNIYAPTGEYSLTRIYTLQEPVSVEQTIGSNTVPLNRYNTLTDLLSSNSPGYYVEAYGGLYRLYIKAGPHQSPVTVTLDYSQTSLGHGIMIGGDTTIEGEDESLTAASLAVAAIILLVALLRRT